MTPEEITAINQRIPGFAQMTPEQQQNIATRLRLSQSMASGEGSLTPSTGISTPGYKGYNSIMSGSTPPPVGIPPPATPTINQPSGLKALTSSSQPSTSSIINQLPPVQAGTGTINAIKNTVSGNQLSPTQEAATALPSFGSSYLINPIQNFLGSGKDADQKGRDAYRTSLKNAGVYDGNYNLTLSDGTKVNMGVDNPTRNYNVNFDEPGIGNIVALTNPFAYLVTGGDPKRASDLAGELTNAIKGSKDPKAEMRNIFITAGITKDQALAGIDALKVDDQTKNVFKGTVNQLNLPSGQSQTGGSNVNVPGGGALPKIIINYPKITPPKPVSMVPTNRMNLLKGMLNNTTQPIQYPTSAPGQQDTGQSFNDNLNKIIGG